ncbi:panthothenate kinase [Neoasaia chiangmaiensis NBRC 101099]|uniref:Nucleoside/nucleotide kinase family protein n=1 Tax=Neoasaia chiangmaiensis TaxID=320497 RepID=A0A1U9KN74_9PROT|nr:nucleoside/nucleotide kinase family protein [Neoasaia chiangmaiensis]AQS87246.1 nucleoside/nucleotide kinase family protein [Neoasaia chiangmaiensis]GBR38433.1 panthothenate kinase [Neoasaia chiangmaiensis NBRC 101099]GEN15896.1 nucleoside/nucleotide kinase family protein [Neoasaia chiangmaiensis]
MTEFNEALARAKALLSREDAERVILGLAGPPGSGKSTLAARLAVEFGDTAIVVPMDGFHLADVELARLDRRQRKGAPDTFDAHGFVALLRRLREETNHIVYAPFFDRRIEEPIAGAIPVLPEHRLVIVEGNYLLCEGAWSPVRHLLDEAWFVQTEAVLRHGWLRDRHISFGRTPADAQAWIAATDDPNARTIEATLPHADWVFDNTPLEVDPQ